MAKNDSSNFAARLVFEHAGIGLALLSTSGWVLQANNAMCKMLGRAKGEIVDSRLSDFCVPEDAASCFDLLTEVAGGQIVGQELELRLLRQDKTRLWVNLNAVCLPAVEGRPQGIVVAVNITSDYAELVKELEQALEDTQSTAESLGEMRKAIP